MDRLTLTVLGAGSWGTALAALAARSGVSTRLWGRDQQALMKMAKDGCNKPYLPDLPLPPELTYRSKLADALSGADVILVAVPSGAFVRLLQSHRAMA